jgi:hypothetical protein
MLRKKYENLICIIKWAVAAYVKKSTQFVCLVLTGAGITNFFYFSEFWPDFFPSVYI